MEAWSSNIMREFTLEKDMMSAINRPVEKVESGVPRLTASGRSLRGAHSSHWGLKLGVTARTHARAGTGTAIPAAASTPAAPAPLGPQRAMAAPALRSFAEVGMTFEDIALYFSREEWSLLDEGQRQLYLNVMLENFELVSSLGCCCGAENVEAPTKENASVRVSQESNPKAALSSQKSHPCESCGLVFRNIFHLTELQGTEYREILLRCGACTKRFFFSVKVDQHHVREKTFIRGLDRISRANSYNFNVSQNHFTCGDVGQGVLTGSGHLHLKAIMSRDSPNAVLKCEMMFQRRNNYYTRKQCKEELSCNHNFLPEKDVHAGSQCFVSSDCGKYLTKFSSFNDQQQGHTGESPYQWNEYGKAFSSSNRLGDPEALHTGERPYEISECGTAFTSSSALHYDQRVHTVERPYEYNECGKSFTSSSNLHCHERGHTGEKPYKCSKCGKAYSSSTKDSCHQRVHTRERPYHCSECGKFLSLALNFIVT
ncbi:hypothetical protein QTO34_010026 [Cnephaeus nilssonii]|uniref:Uncharacterized protein n=1 Tax=Cnephaeus nilssonii TaxID=3371016 RepID=A0AA40HEU3_CNENI|nr:hypothetical protein QTO34_010026 [Eptesicus nilssonii]